MKIKNPNELKDCLVEAACSARSVMLRDHIVPERVVRVGEFITSLRRTMQYGYTGSDKKEVLSICIDSGTWSDILQLKDRRGSYNYMSPSAGLVGDLDNVVEMAIQEMESSNPKMIESSLDDMLKQLNSLDVCVSRAAEINIEADKVVSDFDKLLEEMAG